MSIELPDRYESIFGRALSQMALGNTQEAVDLLSRIVDRLGKLRAETLARKPERQRLLMNAWNSVVQLWRWERRFDEAIAISERFGQNRLDLNVVQVFIASLTIEKGDVKEGLARMRELAEKEQDAFVWSRLGEEYAALNRDDEAEACYQTALPLAQSNAQAASIYAQLFELYRENDRVEDALEAWNMNVVLDRDQADLAHQVYRWLIERGDLEKAQPYLERETNPVLRRFYHGFHDWHSGRQDEAKAQWEEVLDLEVEEDNLAITAWMEAALRLEEPEAAIGLAQELESGEHVPSIDTAVLTGMAYAMLGDVEEAQAQFQGVVRRLGRGWPSLDKIPSGRWALLTSVLHDEETLQAVAPYFER